MKFFIEVQIPTTTIAMDDLFAYVRIKQQSEDTSINNTTITFTGNIRDAALFEVTEESEYLKRSK